MKLSNLHLTSGNAKDNIKDFVKDNCNMNTATVILTTTVQGIVVATLIYSIYQAIQ